MLPPLQGQERENQRILVDSAGPVLAARVKYGGILDQGLHTNTTARMPTGRCHQENPSARSIVGDPTPPFGPNRRATIAGHP